MVALLASGMVLGGILPTVLNVVRSYAPQQAWVVPFVNFASSSVSVLILFYVILLFYKYAPRGLVSIRDVTIPAMTVTALLKIVQYLFDIYLKSYANFNIIYGTFAGVIALMLWIYISGSLLIFGGCLCAVSKEMRVAVLKTRPKK
jgi:Ca2+-transporting ATPase